MKEMDEVDKGTRVTRINAEGEVLYDSGQDGEVLQRPQQETGSKAGIEKWSGRGTSGCLGLSAKKCIIMRY